MVEILQLIFLKEIIQVISSLIGDFSMLIFNTNLADGMVLMYHSANDTFIMGNALGTATIGQLFNVDVGVG